MQEHILPSDPPIPVILRRSGRARRITLRVSGLDGKVTLTLPYGVSDGEALRFAHDKIPWIEKHLAKQPKLQKIAPGVVVPVQGVGHHVQSVPKGRVTLQDGQLLISGDPDLMGRKLAAWFKARARDQLVAASDHYAAKLGRPFSRISIRDTRSRWGSCSPDGALMYSWRLMMAPPDVLNYVAAHEVAHLQELNHSKAFWAVVERLMPGFDAHRKWLRKYGNELHKFQFG